MIIKLTQEHIDYLKERKVFVCNNAGFYLISR